MAFASKYTGAQIEALLDSWSAFDASSLSVSKADTAKALEVYTARPASADVTHEDNLMRYFLATTSMKTNKPPKSGPVLHMAWDNAGGWDTQLAIGCGSAASNHLYTRSQSNGTWGEWNEILDANNFNSYAPKLDGTGATGKWDIQADLNKYSHDSNGEANYPWHLIASATSASSYVDNDALIVIKPYVNGAAWGIAKISMRTNVQTSTASGTGTFYWLATSGIDPADFCVCVYKDASKHSTTCQYFMKRGTYARTEVIIIINRGFTFYDSYDKDDASKNTNCWADLSAAREALIPGSTAYSGISNSSFVGRVKSADQLTTARALWGNSFKGTANINGTLTPGSNATVGTSSDRFANGYFSSLSVSGEIGADSIQCDGDINSKGLIESADGFRTTGYVSVMNSNYNASNA